jgi:hypothetical protein
MTENNKKALDEASKMEAIKNMKSPAIIMNPNDYKKLLSEMNTLTTLPPLYNGIPVHELNYIEEGEFFIYDTHKSNDLVTLPLINSIAYNVESMGSYCPNLKLKL